jgi:3-mercaptopyruvate sulfurtransferase SseA
MQSSTYRHTIRFRGRACPKGSYQLQISEFDSKGHLKGHVYWDFSTFRTLQTFLTTNFPTSQAVEEAGKQTGINFAAFLLVAV